MANLNLLSTYSGTVNTGAKKNLGKLSLPKTAKVVAKNTNSTEKRIVLFIQEKPNGTIYQVSLGYYLDQPVKAGQATIAQAMQQELVERTAVDGSKYVELNIKDASKASITNDSFKTNGVSAEKISKVKATTIAIESSVDDTLASPEDII